MTDENQGVPNVPAETPEQPKVFTQEQVNAIAGQRAMQAKEAGRREAEEKHRREMEANRSQPAHSNDQPPHDVTDKVYQQIQERFNKEAQERQIAQIASNYQAKINEAKGDYEDFDEATKNYDPSASFKLSVLLSGMENGGHILYDLVKNPNKLIQLDTLAEKYPRMAQAELAKLGKSISDNRKAQDDAQNSNVPDPLNRLSPSHVVGTNGKQSIRNIRNQSHLRG
jgi:hypothetical protein